MTDKKLTVLGAGSWGCALACVAARAGHAVTIWGRSSETVNEINSAHSNRRYLDDLKLDESITATTNRAEALAGADIVLLSIPTQQLGEQLAAMKNELGDATLVTTCKGIDQTSGKFPHQLVSEAFPEYAVAALSGPSFATDVVSGLPTAVTIGSADADCSSALVQELSTDTFRCYAASDIKGVELGGALKNVLALAVGATRGMQLGASAEAALIARGFAEITRLAVKLGAKPETLSGLSGLGDLVLTCSTPQSRNFTYGMAMGRGDSLEGLKLAEGAFTASIALKLAREAGVDVPITEAVVNVLERRTTAKEAVQMLLTRPLRRES